MREELVEKRHSLRDYVVGAASSLNHYYAGDRWFRA